MDGRRQNIFDWEENIRTPLNSKESSGAESEQQPGRLQQSGWKHAHVLEAGWQRQGVQTVCVTVSPLISFLMLAALQAPLDLQLT